MTTADTIRDQAVIVLFWRQQLAENKAELEERRKEFEREHIYLLNNIKNGAERLAIEENTLRQMTIGYYEQHGEKPFWPWVGIRIVKRLQYDAAQALVWAKEHGLFLALDAKGFEKFAKQRPPDVPFVEVIEEPQATIATDLQTALAPVATTDELPF